MDRVLVVDDDAMVRDLVSSRLSQEGFEVVAMTAAEAQGGLEGEPPKIALVDGPASVTGALEAQGVTVVPMVAEGGDAAPGALTKPFGPRELLSRVRDALAGGSTPPEAGALADALRGRLAGLSEQEAAAAMADVVAEASAGARAMEKAVMNELRARLAEARDRHEAALARLRDDLAAPGASTADVAGELGAVVERYDAVLEQLRQRLATLTIG